MTSDCVLQKWVLKLTWKEQSALLTSIRGSDTVYDTNLRYLVRWIRRITLYDADVNGKFVHNAKIPEHDELQHSLEYLSMHFVSHLMHGLQIIGYEHPDEIIKEQAFVCYKKICETLHCNVETREQMSERLKDNRELIPEDVQGKGGIR
jgi:hypothetical protein